jgi:hypothetical protein
MRVGVIGGANALRKRGRTHTKASDFFSELQDAIRQKNKIRCGRRQLIASVAIARLAPKDGMWPWAEWMDQPTELESEQMWEGFDAA